MDRTESQLAIIRNYLLKGHTITPLEALSLCGCLRLSAIIYILRHDEMMPICKDQPEIEAGKPYARYWIDEGYLLSLNSSTHKPINS